MNSCLFINIQELYKNVGLEGKITLNFLKSAFFKVLLGWINQLRILHHSYCRTKLLTSFSLNKSEVCCLQLSLVLTTCRFINIWKMCTAVDPENFPDRRKILDAAENTCAENISKFKLNSFHMTMTNFLRMKSVK